MSDQPNWLRLDASPSKEPPDALVIRLYAPPGCQWPRLKLKAYDALRFATPVPEDYDIMDGMPQDPSPIGISSYLKHSDHWQHGWERVSVPAELAEEVDAILADAQALYQERLDAAR